MSVELPIHRPKTRGDCERGPRPCPWVACRHYLAKNPTGHSCALDVADEGEHSLPEIGEILGCTKQRVLRIEQEALRKLGPKVEALVEELRTLNARRAAKALNRVAKPPPAAPSKRGRSPESIKRRNARRVERRREARRKAREAA